VQRSAEARKGTRNPALNLTACKLGNLIASGKLDEAEAREALIQACADNGLLFLHHLNKRAGDSASYRMSGSIAFQAAARTVMIVTHDGEDPDRRVITQAKNNLAEDDTSYAFWIREKDIGDGIVRTYLSWDPIAERKTADEAPSESLHRGQLDTAKDFLQDFLNEGPRSNREAQSSTPMTLSGSVGTWARRRTTRSNVLLLTGSISLRAKLAAGRPPRARPMVDDAIEPPGPSRRWR
jgi:hypothetical protein